MDFLEELFSLGDRKRRKSGGLFQHDKHHDDDDDDDDDHDGHNRQRQYPASAYPQPVVDPAVVLSSVICRKCPTQIIQGAKFCHGCGAAVETILNCASCGSKLPVNAPFCPQCGYKNG